MAARIYKCLYKSYNLGSVLGISNSTIFKSISLLKDLNKLFKSLVLFKRLISTLNTIFIALFVARYIKKEL